MSKRDGIRKRGNSWEVCVSLGWDEQEGRYRRRYATVKGTRADAERKKRELLQAIELGTSVDPTKQTIASYLDGWLEYCQYKGLALRTLEGYRGITERYIVPALGNVRLQKLSPMQIERLYSYLLTQGRQRGAGGGLSKRTVLHTHRMLHGALTRAVRLRLIPANPCDAVEPPKPRRKEMHALDEHETTRLLRLLESGEDFVLFLTVLIAVTTGMRRGEILALRWSDIDLEAGTATVRRSLQKTKRSGLIFKEPKTTRSHRTITLPARTIRKLQRHRTQQAQNRLQLGAAYDNQRLVLARGDGSPFNPDTLSLRFRTFRTAHGFSVRFHDLRHTHATLMLKAGESVKVVADRLGHSTAMLTLDTYAHVLPGMDADAAERFDQMLEDAEWAEDA